MIGWPIAERLPDFGVVVDSRCCCWDGEAVEGGKTNAQAGSEKTKEEKGLISTRRTIL